MPDIIEKIGVMKAKDEDGNVYALYPETKMEAIEGLSTILNQINGNVSEMGAELEKLEPDATLSVEGKAADAKAVGDRYRLKTYTSLEQIGLTLSTFTSLNDLPSGMFLNLSLSNANAAKIYAAGDVLPNDSGGLLQVFTQGVKTKALYTQGNTTWINGNTGFPTYDWVGWKKILGQDDMKVFTNTSVATSAWGTYTASLDQEADIIAAGYTYKADVTLDGVTANHAVTVNFGVAAINEGIYAPYVNSQAGKIRIYANEKPSAALTIPTITAIKKI